MLTGTAVTVGRSRSCSLAYADPDLSRRHCAIEKRPDGFLVRDLGSRNGTYVNGQRVQESMLNSGDTVKAGHIALRFRMMPMPDEKAAQLLDETATREQHAAHRTGDARGAELDETATREQHAAQPNAPAPAVAIPVAEAAPRPDDHDVNLWRNAVDTIATNSTGDDTDDDAMHN